MKIQSVLLFLLVSAPCHSVRFPVMTSAEITKCGSPTCGNAVAYAGTSEVLDIGTPALAGPLGPTKILAFGVHCSTGPDSNGQFGGCKWEGPAIHSPNTTQCLTTTPGSWDVGNSPCTTSATWGEHSGARPGGECVLFGRADSNTSMTIETPFGIISAYDAANGGNRFCIKPLPPGVTCEVYLPPAIDHGVVMAGTEDRKNIDGAIDCGRNPAISVVGNPVVIVAPGIVAQITNTLISDNHLRVQSDMTVGASATPGSYSASIIISVSPP